MGIKIDSDKCDGCGNCVEICKIVWMGEIEECRECKISCNEENCEYLKQNIIVIKNGKAKVNNFDLCRSCYNCLNSCPNQAISKED